MPNIDWEWLACGPSWLAVGLFLGYIAGRLHNDQRMIKEYVMERKTKPVKDERGISTHRISADIAAAVIVVITAIAAFQSNQASNDGNAAIEQIQTQNEVRARENRCISSVWFATVQALNERTTYSGAQAQANRDLQEAQAELLAFFLNRSDSTEEEARAKIQDYFGALRAFLDLANKTLGQQTKFDYPTEDEFVACLRQAQIPAQEDK